MYFSSNSVRAMIALATLALATVKTAAAQDLQVGTLTPLSGGTATISGSGTTASGTFQYLDSNVNPAPLPPGTTSYNQVNDVGPSLVTLETGGTVNLLIAVGGNANILGGSISTLVGENNDLINISDGFITTIGAGNGSIANIHGGTIDTLNAAAAGFANVYGGKITLISANVSGTADIFGGNISALSTEGISTINLFGTGLTETFQSSNPFPGGGKSNYYLINGILQDGTPIVNLPYTDYNGQGHLNLNSPVPEASTSASFGLAVLLLGGSAIAAKRKRGSFILRKNQGQNKT